MSGVSFQTFIGLVAKKPLHWRFDSFISFNRNKSGVASQFRKLKGETVCSFFSNLGLGTVFVSENTFQTFLTGLVPKKNPSIGGFALPVSYF